MRLVVFAIVLGLTLPVADAKGSKTSCTNRCDSMYQFCLKNARSKQARAACKKDRKSCKGQCG